MDRIIWLPVAVLAFATPAHADDPMMLRAGEWRIVREQPIPSTEVICYPVDRPLGQMTGRSADDCVQKRGGTGSLITVDAICRVPGKLVTVHETIRLLDADTYRADSLIRFHRPGHTGGTGVTIRVTATRLGPCQPGDTPG